MSLQNNANKGKDRFEWTCILILIVVTFLMLSAIATVFIGGLRYLEQTLKSKEICFAIILSLKTATISTLIGAVIAIPCGYALSYIDVPLKGVVKAAIQIPLSLPCLVLGLCLLMLFSTPFGIFLKENGFKFVFDQKGIVMVHLFLNLPFMIKSIENAFLEVDPRLEFIAKTLGASKFKTFFTITMPLCKHALVSTFIVAWSRAIGEFGGSLMLVGVTRMKTETLPGSIFLSISSGENGIAMAAAIIMIVISCLALFITNYLSSKCEINGRMQRGGPR